MQQCDARQSANIDEILRSTSRLSFSITERQHLIHFLNKEADNGLIVRFHPTMTKEDVASALEQGIVLLQCPQIESDILFLKLNDGRGFLGRQKSRVANYISVQMANAFTAGGSHALLIGGLTGINNIFRHRGLLSGMAL